MISNSSPLIFLAKINSLNLIKNLFNFIEIPEEVKKEILIKEKEGFISLEQAIKENWIKTVQLNKNIDYSLGKGENAAINLAKEKNKSLMIDDSKAIKIAESLGIKTLRTTSLIFLALKKKLINKGEAIKLINKLIESGYYISPSIYTKIIERLL